MNLLNQYILEDAIEKQNFELASNIRSGRISAISTVFKTNDYSIFKTLNGNRNVNKIHLRRLRESFKKLYLITVIIINRYYEVIDGQHRLEAATALGLPVYYIIIDDYGLKEVQVLNSNMKSWNKVDYLNGYCDLGYPDYLKFRDFMGMFKDLPLAVCESLLRNTANTTNARSTKELVGINKKGSYSMRFFEEGNLVINDYDLAVENANKIMMIKPYYDGYNRTYFVFAMIGMFKHKNYDHSIFMRKLSMLPNALKHCPNVTQYKMLIEDIYNYKNKNKVSLRY